MCKCVRAPTCFGAFLLSFCARRRRHAGCACADLHARRATAAAPDARAPVQWRVQWRKFAKKEEKREQSNHPQSLHIQRAWKRLSKGSRICTTCEYYQLQGDAKKIVGISVRLVSIPTEHAVSKSALGSLIGLTQQWVSINLSKSSASNLAFYSVAQHLAL